MANTAPFSSGAYWEARYRNDGTSGKGSAGRLAKFKASVINRFIAENNIKSVIDLGCGDASQLALLELPTDYTGIDVSPAALERCAARFPGRRFASPGDLPAIPPAELTLSLDVIYHLVEDEVFAAAMLTLFNRATRFVLIYASNLDAEWPASHVRHRRFTDHVAATQPGWRLLAHLPNPYPYDPTSPDDTSFADFFIYGRDSALCSIVVPATA
jgi:SAM-dependent methyltransferase